MRLGPWMAALALSMPAYGSSTDYWRTTEISPEFTSLFINKTSCNTTEMYRRSCQAALESVGLEGTENVDAAMATLTSAAERARAINAHLKIFDPYARLLPAAELAAERSTHEAAYVGVGMSLERSARGLSIYEVHPDSPAERAGLLADDVVLAIAADGASFRAVADLSVSDVTPYILGEEYSDVGFIVRRDGRELAPIFMKRGKVVVPAVKSSVIESGLAYLRIRNFGSFEVCDEARAQLEALKDFPKLILDLRGNGGGDKYVTMCVAEVFLGQKKVVGTRYVTSLIPALTSVMGPDAMDFISENEIVFEGGEEASTFDGQMVVLIDSFTASGAEILAGAIQDHQRGWLVGERSYGKGSAQSYFPIPGNDSLIMAWTSERFFLPSGRSNQGVGISPDFEVAPRLGLDRSQWPNQRETERFDNGLEPLGPAWVPSRPGEVAALKSCLEVNAFDRIALDRLVTNEEPPDYPRAYAMGLLKCLP